MTATGSHIDFGFAVRSTTLQGKALAGASLVAPTTPHPSALTGSHLPPGEGYPQKDHLPTPREKAFPLFRQPPRRFLLLKDRYPAGGACRRPYSATPGGDSRIGFFSPYTKPPGRFHGPG